MRGRVGRSQPGGSLKEWGYIVGRAPIAVALDSPDLAEIGAWVMSVRPHVTTVKVGLELFLAHGRQALAALDLTLSADEIRALESPYLPHAVVGFE